MYFVGVDLAWGDRNPTGVAAVDAGGVLRHVAACRTDDEILDELRPYVAGDCVVAFDAPLVVTNATGTRPCESALNRDFRRFDAGAHPANTGLAWFADGGRAARLAATLGLSLDPRGAATRKALEVYPHAASVVLFELSKTLKYKQKVGRDVDTLRSELLRLMAFVQSLATASPSLQVSGHPEWIRLRTSVHDATRKSQLRRAEDPVDAVVCAHIARYATERPADITVYGDVATGCIVTPTCPGSASPR